MQKVGKYVKTLITWLGARWQHWLTRLNERARANKAKTIALPPFSAKTWPLYLDIVLQAFKTIIYYAVAVLAIGTVFGIGLLAGYFAAIVNDTPVPTRTAMQRTLNNVDQSTNLYFADNVELTHVKSDLIRDAVNLDQVSPWVQKAIIATEDEDFYANAGVSPKAVVRAVFSEFTGVGSQTGGSTLTQQVVKLQFLNSETTFKRKVTEIMYALRINHFFSKENILQAYLNIATFGRNNKGQNIAGIQTAAQGLFSKNAKDLTLPEAAFIAGLPQSPSVYTPYTASGTLKRDISAGIQRQHTVLFRMYRAGSITKKEYHDALAFDLKKDFQGHDTESDDATTKYAYVYNMVTSEAKSILARQLAKADGHTQADLDKDSALQNQYLTQAQTLLTTKGYQVHSTINKQVYDSMQTVVKNNAYTFGTTYSSSDIDPETGEYTTESEPVQNGSVLLNNRTGAVIGFVGGVSGELNHIYTTRSPGSSIKPLAVYGPAIENRVIGSQSMLADFKTNFPNYSVTDYGGQIQNQFISATDALANSYNIPAVNLYDKLRQSVNVQSYLTKLGISTLTAHDYAQLGLALGGTDYGVTVEDQASAYTTFENGGRHTDAYVIDSIMDPGGNVIYKHHENPTQVFTPATTYIMQQMMHSVITKGTAASLNYQLSFDTSNLIGKTGTSNDYKDIWFVGSTPGVTLASWIGYDNANGTAYNLSSSASETNLAYWAKLANATYKLIPNTFKADETPTEPSGVARSTVNKLTGQHNGNVDFDGTNYAVSGDTVTNLYNGTAPTTATSQFGIGGTMENYKLFWEYVGGKRSNGYGKVTTEYGANSNQ
ncbi:transglycosylase domain-containing protein [Lacticaseibacillus baoqingensis]|uniref:Transglycosylase domain-containing protein n=1 Tax=Lacticaseibacillus baoqingensis TaxID=2486013 RepID=A0ABW4E9Z7_9LACO